MMRVGTAQHAAPPTAAQGLFIDDTRTFGALLLHGELRVIASRVVHAVLEFFRGVLEFFRSLSGGARRAMQFTATALDASHVRREREEVTGEVAPSVEEEATPFEKLMLMKALSAFAPEKRIFLENLTESIPREERAGVVRATTRFIPLLIKGSKEAFEANYKARVKVMTAFKDLSAEEREAVIALAEQQIDPEMDVEAIAEIIEATIGIHQDQRAWVISTTDLLMPRYVRSSKAFRASKAKVMEVLKDLPAEEREEVVELAGKLIKWMNADDRAEIIGALSGIPQDQRAGLVSATALLMPRELEEKFINPLQKSYKPRIMKALKDLPAEERGEVVELAQQQIDPEMGIDGRAEIIEALSSIPKAQRAGVLSITDLLMPRLNGFRTRDRARAMKALKDLSAEEREEVRELAEQQIDPEIGVDGRAEIIEAIRGIPKAQRAEVLSATALLLPLHVKESRKKFLGSFKARVMTAFRDLPAEERAEVIGLAQQLIDREMEGLDRVAIIEALRGIPKAQRAEVVSATALLLPRHLEVHKDSRGVCKARVMEVFKDLPPEERGELIELAEQQIDPEMGESERAWIIEVLRRIPKAQRAEVVSATALFMSRQVEEFMTSSEKIELKGEIMGALKDLPVDDRQWLVMVAPWLAPARGYRYAKLFKILTGIVLEERNAFLWEAFKLIDKEMPNPTRLDWLKRLANTPAPRRADFVGETLRQMEQDRLLAIAPDPVLGLNIHTRDERAREAMQLLWKHQKGAVSEAQIEKATEDFIEYLDLVEMPPEDRAKAKKALLDPKGEGEHFGALIEKDTFSLAGLTVSGSDLIGRLWIFASHLPDPKEEEIAKYGMITALRVESYNDEGKRICNQRKAQAQFLAVLQGRLDGVVIDREGLLSGPEAMEIFFQKEEHQHLPTREALYLAAIGFCHASHRVEKQSFMAEIEGYAGLTF